MRILALTLAAAVALALPACGGGDDDDGGAATQREPGTVSTPAALPDQTEDGPAVERADLESCLEGEGLQVLQPQEQVPGTNGGRLEVGVESAEQIGVFWPDSGNVADVFVAEDSEAAGQTEEELLEFFSAFGATEDQIGQFIQRAGNVIVTPDNENGPDADELAALRGCIG